MPRSFDLLVESSVSVEQIHSAFSEEDYWLARLATFGIGTLDSLIKGTDGSVTVDTIQDLRRDWLRGLVAKLYPSDLKVVHNETWSPIGGGQVRRGGQRRGARGPGIRAWRGFAGTGAERLAPEVHP